MRMSNYRFARVRNALSKKIERRTLSVAMKYMYSNFARIHEMFRIIPAMAAGITEKLWSVADSLGMIGTAGKPHMMHHQAPSILDSLAGTRLQGQVLNLRVCFERAALACEASGERSAARCAPGRVLC